MEVSRGQTFVRGCCEADLHSRSVSQAAKKRGPGVVHAGVLHVWRMFSTSGAASLAAAVQTAGLGRRAEREEVWGGCRAVLAKVRQAETAGSVGTVREGMFEMLRDTVSLYSQTARGREAPRACACVCVQAFECLCKCGCM